MRGEGATPAWAPVTYIAGVTRGTNRQLASVPSVVFALAFVSLGWIASHTVAYGLVGLLPDGHHHGEEHVHGYMGPLKLAGGLVFAFGMALRFFSATGLLESGSTA